MDILFITANRLGDAVISTGVLAALEDRYPQARFTVVCGPVPAGLFTGNPRVARVIVMEKRRHDRHWLEVWRQCVGRRWAMVVDLRGSLLSLALRARRRVIVRGGRGKGRKLEQLSRALSGVLGAGTVLAPRLALPGADEAAARRLLPEGRFLALGSTANWDGKLWPAARFAEMARDLRAEGLRPAVFYGPGTAEKARALPVLDALPDALDLGGDRSLGEVAALLKRCALFVGNDSGLMHLAAAAGTPTLGLFGPSRVSEYAPSGPCAHALAAPGPEGAASLDDLPTETVLAAARAVLAGREPP